MILYLCGLQDSTSDGDIGNRAAANVFCTNDSNAPTPPAGTTYTHAAVLSYAGDHPRNLLSDGATRPVFRRNGSTQIADNYDNFFDSTYTAASSISTTTTAYWTGLDSNGVHGTYQFCNAWIEGVAPYIGHIGDPSSTDSDRFSSTSAFCSASNALLCISY